LGPSQAGFIPQVVWLWRDDLELSAGFKLVGGMSFFSLLMFLSVVEVKVSVCEQQNTYSDVTGV
jgi:hypothetical protein